MSIFTEEAVYERLRPVKLTRQLTHKIILALEHAAESPLYIPFVGLLTAADAFVPIIPNEVVLISAVVAQPQSWFMVYVSGTIGSALGAAVFSGLASRYGAKFIVKLFPHLINSKGWIETTHYVQAKGFLGLSLVSLSPLPQHAAVAVAGMAHMTVMTVFWAVVLGRTPKYLAVCWASIYAKGTLRKLKLLPAAHGEVQNEIDNDADVDAAALGSSVAEGPSTANKTLVTEPEVPPSKSSRR